MADREYMFPRVCIQFYPATCDPKGHGSSSVAFTVPISCPSQGFRHSRASLSLPPRLQLKKIKRRKKKGQRNDIGKVYSGAGPALPPLSRSSILLFYYRSWRSRSLSVATAFLDSLSNDYPASRSHTLSCLPLQPSTSGFCFDGQLHKVRHLEPRQSWISYLCILSCT